MQKPIQTGIASFGMSGQVFHGPLLKMNPHFRVKTILERTKNTSVHLFPAAEIVRDYEAMLNDREIELIIVNTPDQYHFEMARKALLAGKNVIVEKPFTLKCSEADELIELARSTGVILTIYQNRRWDGDFMTVKEVIESGVLGRIIEFESHFDRYRPNITPSTWKEEGDEYAGVLYNLGSHMVDQVLVLFGMPGAVTAHLQIVRTGGKVFDYYDIRLHYRGFNALLKCSYLVKEEGPRYIVHGTQGSFLKRGIDPQEESLKNGFLPTGNSWGLEPETYWGILNAGVNDIELRGKVVTIPGNYEAFYENLFEAIRLGKPLAVKPEEARNTILILEACLESNKTKKTIKLKIDNWD